MKVRDVFDIESTGGEFKITVGEEYDEMDHVETLVRALADEIESSLLVDERAPDSEVRELAQRLADTAIRVLRVRRTCG